MEFTPENITFLPKDHIFVFGSNRAGRHGRGAAKLAVKKFGAVYGKGDGIMGQSYGIATKGHKMEVLSLKNIEVAVYRFLRFASKKPHLTFVVTKIGCGLAGYNDKDIAPMFASAGENVVLPKGW